MKVLLRLAFFALSAALLTACGGDDDTTGSSTTGTPAGDPTIAFVSPQEGEVISGGPNGGVDVELAITNTTDLYILLTPDGDTSKQSQMNAKTTSISGLFAGSHKLTAELVKPDLAPYDPAIVAEVSFEVVP